MPKTDCQQSVVVKDDANQELNLSANALRVLKARYLKKDEQGKLLETPDDLFRRVARAVADAELNYDSDATRRGEWEERFYRLMATRRFMPNSPTLMNAGREMGMLSACFVLPVGDSINEIFDSIKHTALIQKAGGGTGFAFDELRPTGDYIKSSGGTTSGPISFWRAFSEATNAIQQGAFRRGANMGMMYIDHPDILKFLHAKQDLTQFTNYNISVKVTDAWMDGMRADPQSAHVVRNPRNNERFVIPKSVKVWEYDMRTLVRVGADGAVPEVEGGVYSKQDIWDIILDHAWQTGEPGVVFIDRINQANPTPHIGRMEATNPCGEQPLLPYEACNLGSVNVHEFVTDPCTPDADIDWESMRETIHECVRFLDDVIDVNRYPLEQIRVICQSNRKIGLGIMGFADALYALGVAYNSQEGIEWGERFMQFVNDEAHAASEALAGQRGCFQNWPGSTWDRVHQRKMRNACSTTVAPTGTISIIGGCSGGIEPLFGLVFYRNVLKGQDDKKTMVELNPVFEKVARAAGFLSEELMDRIAKDGTLAHIDGIPEDVRRVFVCTGDVSADWHVRMQAAFQKHCDASISKTINFPHDAKREDVAMIYNLSYDLQCKGVTVYRDGCRESQPMSRVDERANGQAKSNGAGVVPHTALPANATAPAPHHLDPVELGEVCSAVRTRQMTPFGNMHVQITVDPRTERELEVFAQLGKGGDLANSDLEAICRLISLWLRSGGALQHVIRQLKGIGSSLQVSTKEGKIMSLGDGLARALDKYARSKTRFGLRSLLLGEFDLQELEHTVAGKATRLTQPERRQSNGNGKANGHASSKTNGNAHGNGNGHKQTNGEGASQNAGPSQGHRHGDDRSALGAGGCCVTSAGNGSEPSFADHARDAGLSGNGSGRPGNGSHPAPAMTAAASMAAATAIEFSVTSPSGSAATGVETIVRHGQKSATSAAVPVAEARSSLHQQYKVLCPDCQCQLSFAEGCVKCEGCGFAQC